jgi:hypothetical protein
MAALLVGVHYTGALFTDTQSLGTNSFISGTVDISTSPGSALFNLNALAPGDLATAALTVTNSGSLQMRYAVKGTTSENTLAGALNLSIRSGVSSCTTPGFLLTGTPLYSGILGNLTGLNLIGDATPGNQAGDRVLNGGASETLCVQVGLPLLTGNLLQGLTDLASLDFVAEQVANNP